MAKKPGVYHWYKVFHYKCNSNFENLFKKEIFIPSLGTLEVLPNNIPERDSSISWLS